jgi:heat-inducible transcriptional repressor
MLWDDEIDERKKTILKAIIDDYIGTAEPIGSRTIARKHELGLSSATIRNEMADLEEMGYLEQPHTSAGRIPSNRGYRLYVDQLMNLREPTVEEIESIRIALDVKINELNQLIRQASVIMSKITKYTSLAATPKMNKSTLKSIQVVPIESKKVLIVVVTATGIVKHSLVKIPEDVSPDFIISFSSALNIKLSGLTIEQINLSIIKEMERDFGLSKEVIITILSELTDCINQIDNSEVYLDGTTNIFNYPEFKDVMKAKEFLNVLDEKDIIRNLLSNNVFNNKINIKIGTENQLEEIKECSLITATYSIGDLLIGSFGIIGPTRMEYAKVISSMNYIRKVINREIKKMIGDSFSSG